MLLIATPRLLKNHPLQCQFLWSSHPKQTRRLFSPRTSLGSIHPPRTLLPYEQESCLLLAHSLIRLLLPPPLLPLYLHAHQCPRQYLGDAWNFQLQHKHTTTMSGVRRERLALTI